MVSLIGCVQKVDLLSEFTISGRIYEKGPLLPLTGAMVYFVDRGFDSYRSKIENAKEIGWTDSLGTINQKFEYFWGYDRSWFHKEPPMTFEILVIKDGFMETMVFFKVSDLNVSGETALVPLGDIFLKRK